MTSLAKYRIAIVGSGPAGLMAAEILGLAGADVTIFEAMAAPARKLLLAGKSGLNITNAEPDAAAIRRYEPPHPRLHAALAAFPGSAVREFADRLGAETFTGSSGRVFPKAMKASPLLRAWLARLAGAGVRLATGHRWIGWDNAGGLRFETAGGEIAIRPDATVLALGGASWPRVGANADWVPLLAAQGLAIRPLKPANMGFDAAWSAAFKAQWAGTALKSVAFAFDGARWRAEAMITSHGLEGGAIYAAARALREAIARDGTATLAIDLFPNLDAGELRRRLAAGSPGASTATRLRKGLKLDGIRLALVRECTSRDDYGDPARLAPLLKALPVRLLSPRPLAEAISTAGGVAFDDLDDGFMARALPGVFLAGEMLDWEAPTGGYLISGCLATGRAAGLGARHWLESSPEKQQDTPTKT